MWTNVFKNRIQNLTWWKKSLQQNKIIHFYQARFCLWKKKQTQSVLVICILIFYLVTCHSHIDTISRVVHNINVGQIDLEIGETFCAVAHRLRIKTRVSEETQRKWTCVISAATLQRLFSSPWDVSETSLRCLWDLRRLQSQTSLWASDIHPFVNDFVVPDVEWIFANRTLCHLSILCSPIFKCFLYHQRLERCFEI